MPSPLTLSFQDTFSREEEPGSPPIGIGQGGLFVHAKELGSSREKATFALQCSYKFSEAFSRCFGDVSHALVLFVEDPEGGRAAAVRLEDPTLHFYPGPTPNFLASRGAGGNSSTLIGGWVNALVELGGFLGRDPPTLYVRVAIQTLLSPTLELRFLDRTVSVHP